MLDWATEKRTREEDDTKGEGRQDAVSGRQAEAQEKDKDKR